MRFDWHQLIHVLGSERQREGFSPAGRPRHAVQNVQAKELHLANAREAAASTRRTGSTRKCS